jgi:CheY-like chemotaxis protein
MEIMEKEAEVLVVDDEPSVALAVKSALKFCGYAVLTVPDGEAAMERVRAEPRRFAVVLSDHNMPGLGGLALVKALRAANYPGGIIILSAFLSRGIEVQYEALGVDQILSKPFNIERLRLAMERSLPSRMVPLMIGVPGLLTGSSAFSKGAEARGASRQKPEEAPERICREGAEPGR